MTTIRLAIVVLVTGLFVATLGAHPGSTTTVSIDLRAGNADVTIVSDAEALATKLEFVTQARATGAARDLSPASFSRLPQHLDLRFDGMPAPLSIAHIAVDANAQATIHLTGAVPSTARTLTWATPLVYGAYPVAVRANGHETLRWVQGRDTSETFALDAAGPRTFLRGVWLGFTHILPRGLDHMLFVVGLLLLSTRASQLLLQVSAFTLAHSLTLGLCLYGVVSLPSRIVEPLIALSVAYVGLENLVASRLRSWRVALVFAFGLLHGLGFAEALASLNLSREDFVATLVSFNVGVELGQLTVIAAAATLLYGGLRARREGWRRPVVRFASCAVGVMGLIWTVERLI